MNRKSVVFGFIVAMFTLSGCAHMHNVQGPEPKSEIPEGIRVAIGSKEVKEGEKVNVLRSKCKEVSGGRAGTRKSCTDQKVGEATVLKVLDHDSAIVQPDPGVSMDSSMRVEKLSPET